jgi:hypothetical protein
MSQYRPDRERAVLYLLEMRRALLESVDSEDEASDEADMADVMYLPARTPGWAAAA